MLAANIGMRTFTGSTTNMEGKVTAREGEGRNIFCKMKLKDLNSTINSVSVLSHSLTVLRKEAEQERTQNHLELTVTKQASVSVQVAKTC